MTPDDRTLRVHARQRFSSGVVIAPDLDVDLDPGSVLVLFGPSGAGKSTILRQLAGLELPQAGAIVFRGSVWFDADRRTAMAPQERRAPLVFQTPALFPHLSVGDNIAYGTARRSERMIDAVAQLDLAALLERKPRALSGGQAQRVALARALATNPALLLLDEPFVSLDAPTRSRLRRDLRTILQRTGTPAVLVTHDRTEALAIGDRVAVVIDGQVRQTGPVSQVFSHPADALVAETLGVESVLPARIRSTDGGLLEVEVNGISLQVAERMDPGPIGEGDDVYVCIRAEDVTLESRSGGTTASARNHLAGHVVTIVYEGAVDRVTLDCGFMLDALITRRSGEDMGLAPGAQVTAAIKATSIHLVRRS